MRSNFFCQTSTRFRGCSRRALRGWTDERLSCAGHWPAREQHRNAMAIRVFLPHSSPPPFLPVKVFVTRRRPDSQAVLLTTIARYNLDSS
jgi:hypothetical protein